MCLGSYELILKKQITSDRKTDREGKYSTQRAHHNTHMELMKSNRTESRENGRKKQVRWSIWARKSISVCSAAPVKTSNTVYAIHAIFDRNYFGENVKVLVWKCYMYNVDSMQHVGFWLFRIIWSCVCVEHPHFRKLIPSSHSSIFRRWEIVHNHFFAIALYLTQYLSSLLHVCVRAPLNWLFVLLNFMCVFWANVWHCINGVVMGW